MKQRMVSFSLIGFMTLGVVCLMIASTPRMIASGSAPTATASPIPTLIPAGTSNTVWTPQEQDFDGVTMVLVPAGCFRMGTPDDEVATLIKERGTDWFNNQKPVHEVCFDQPFWIDKTEVTNGQFTTFKGKAEHKSIWTEAARPRERINWYEAALYCGTRGARLPSEAEWEYAVRGPDSLVFPWGNEFVADNVVYTGNSGGETAIVGSRAGGVSWVGAWDMSGNVWEWTNTIYDKGKFPYPYKANDGRESTSDTNSDRVLRGGGWNIHGDLVRATVRFRDTPGYGHGSVGFRCARSYENETSLAVSTSAPTTIASAATPIPAGTSNKVWTPQTQDFDGVTMVLVPPGCFRMGTPDDQVAALIKEYNTDWFNNQKPVHEVCFDQPFWMDKTEVTNGQFETFKGKAERESNWTAAERPREQINWYEAALYCGARGARLPSEAEWEYSARGPDSLVFPWGNEFVADNVVYYGNSGRETVSVGSRPGGVSWVGALDMSGNVREWTNTIYDQEKFPYPYKADDGRESTDDINSSRVLRGGSWYGYGSGVRAANRVGYAPDGGYYDFGFRCARSYN